MSYGDRAFTKKAKQGPVQNPQDTSYRAYLQTQQQNSRDALEQPYCSIDACCPQSLAFNCTSSPTQPARPSLSTAAQTSLGQLLNSVQHEDTTAALPVPTPQTLHPAAIPNQLITYSCTAAPLLPYHNRTTQQWWCPENTSTLRTTAA